MRRGHAAMNALARIALALWLLASACGASAADAVPVGFPSLDRTPLQAWLYRPTGPARATVVALHGCGGLYAGAGSRKGLITSRHDAMAQMLTQAGYAVLFPDSLGSRGVREICTQKMGQRSITQTERRRDALAALPWLQQQDWASASKVALLGWSHGGSAVLAATDASDAEVAAQPLRFAPAMAFYPGCGAALKSGYRPNTALTLFLAGNDDWTPPLPCVELGRRVGAELHVYPDSYHDFDNPVSAVRLRSDVPNGVHPGQGVHAGGNPVAREQAYQRVLQLLAQAFP